MPKILNVFGLTVLGVVFSGAAMACTGMDETSAATTDAKEQEIVEYKDGDDPSLNQRQGATGAKFKAGKALAETVKSHGNAAGAGDPIPDIDITNQ